MVMVRASIAALVARAARHRALTRHAQHSASIRSSPLAIHSTASLRGWLSASQLSAHYATSSKKKLPSLVISEAFDDAEEDDDDAIEHGDDDDDLSFDYDMEEEEKEALEEPQAVSTSAPSPDLTPDDKQAIARSFRFAMDRKKEWMVELVNVGDFDMLLRVVYECYEPLYLTHPRLACEECSLQSSYVDAAAVAEKTTRFRPKWYDDRVTKITEQEAMALCVGAGRADLALAVFKHREWIASTVHTVTLPSKDVLTGDRTVDLRTHFRGFYSWAMGAVAILGDHTSVFTIYETALEKDILPTANMTQHYLLSLVAKREYGAVVALYEQVQKDDRPVNLYFYRQMLFVARTACNATIMRQVVDEMKFKGFKLRIEDYFNAVRALDDQYYFQPKSVSASTRPRPMVETYHECVDRIHLHDQDVVADKNAKIEAACEHVLKLFDEMVDDEQLLPTETWFFSRVITAATLLHQYERVGEYVAMYESVFNKPLDDPAALSMATNALLLLDEPEAAWELVFKGSRPPTKRRELNVTRVHVRPMDNVVQYLVHRKSVSALGQLLTALESRRQLGAGVVSDDALVSVLRLWIHDTDTLSDDQLLELVDTNWRAFPIRVDTKWLALCVDECIRANRWPLLLKTIHRRGRKQIARLPKDVGIRVSERAIVGESPSRDQLELVTRLARMMDMSALTRKEKVAFHCNVLRAHHQLLANDPSEDERRYRQHEIAFIRDKILPRGVWLPKDVLHILLANL